MPRTRRSSVATFLRRHGGLPFCGDCLALYLGRIWQPLAAWAEVAPDGTSLSDCRCANCGKRGEALMLLSTGAPRLAVTPLFRAVLALVATGGNRLCDECLAVRAALGRVEAVRLARLLQRRPRYVRRTGRCRTCGVVAAVTLPSRVTFACETLVNGPWHASADFPGVTASYVSVCCGYRVHLNAAAALPPCGWCQARGVWARVNRLAG